MPQWAPSEEGSRSEGIWGTKLVRHELTASPAGLVPQGPRGSKTAAGGNFISANIVEKGKDGPFRVAGIRTLEEVSDLQRVPVESEGMPEPYQSLPTSNSEGNGETILTEGGEVAAEDELEAELGV